MRARVYIYILSVLLLAGCNKSPVTEGTDMHEFTQEELQKKRLDDAFTVFFKKFNLDKVDNPTAEILSNSKVTIPSVGMIRYTYTKNGLTLISMDVSSGGFVATLHGGIRLEGVGLGENGTKVFIVGLGENGTKVFIDGDQLATLDMVLYNNVPTPVFRFPDGTTYAVTGVLLVEPLIDFLLKNVLSTE